MERSFGITTGATSASAEPLGGRGNRFLGKTISWTDLLASQRILLIAEAGAGKTHECVARAEMLFERGEPAFFLRLETVAASGVRSSLYGEHLQQRFDDWRASSSQIGYFFLDSIDELLLVHGDYRIDALVEAIASSQAGWTTRIARWVAQNFYPDQLSEDQLVRLLTALQRVRGREDHLSSNMATVMERVSVDPNRLECLLPGLLALTRSLVVVSRQEDDLGDRKGHLQASCILRGLCIRLLEEGSQVSDLPEAAVLGFRAAGYTSLDHERKQKLGTLIEKLPVDWRRAVFEADLACLARLERRHAIHGLLGRLMYQGPLQYSLEKDAAWILRDLADAGTDPARRSMLLHMLMQLVDEGEVDQVDPIRAAIADSAALVSELDSLLKARASNRSRQEAREQQQKRDERRALKAASDKADWMTFWADLAHRPALALAPGRVQETIWNLSTVLSKRSRGNDRGRWDREFLEQTFSAPVTDALRRSLMTYWRGMEPTLPSKREEKNTYLVVWTLGLMGLYAEAEDPRWTRTITQDDAELAVRYVFVELNGLPDWLAALTSAYPDVVERILGGEIESDLLAEGVDRAWHSMLLQSLRHGRWEIARVLEPRLLGWLKGPGMALMRSPHHAIAEAKLDQVVRVLLVHGSLNAKLWLRELATCQAIAAGTGPFLFFWLPVLMRLDPPRSAELLLHILRNLPIQRKGVAVQAIGSLFSERRVESTPNWSTALEPDVLLRLNQAIYRHVAEKDDERHASVYTPGPRDNAEDARRNVFNALINALGAEAYQAKLALSADPLFSHAKDRIAALAHERLAEETDDFIVLEGCHGRHKHGGERVHYDLVLLPRPHLLERGFDDGPVVVEVKLFNLDSAAKHDTKARDLLWQCVAYSFSEIEMPDEEIQRPLFVLYFIGGTGFDPLHLQELKTLHHFVQRGGVGRLELDAKHGWAMHFGGTRYFSQRWGRTMHNVGVKRQTGSSR